jgi:UDP-N-acetylglucosamine--N-acetylmuramyl-(pentapeptide) pyrophosphoryl-undecaprenol N-acetylglucosamine transferase
MGGSLGAMTINNAMVDIIADNYKNDELCFIHAMGQYGLWVPDKLREKGVDLDKVNNIEIREYISDMDVCMPAADVVICRAGASSLSELQALGKASILIPSPNVAENHQYHNAMALVNKGAALIIEEKDLTKEKMQELFESLVCDNKKRLSIEDNAKAMAVSDAKGKIADIVLSLIK